MATVRPSDERAREEARNKIAQAQGRERPAVIQEMSPDDLKRLYASDSRSSNTDSS